jgi:acid phosphatase family membrane protein YuiD
MDLGYSIVSFLAWLVTGLLKFLINSLQSKKLAFDLIGYGGLPSNHSAIVSSIVSLIGFREGFNHPTFGLAITLAFIVIMDAGSLRSQVGKHAIKINQISKRKKNYLPLRERIGHSRIEILTGVVVGVMVGWSVSLF